MRVRVRVRVRVRIRARVRARVGVRGTGRVGFVLVLLFGLGLC